MVGYQMLINSTAMSECRSTRVTAVESSKQPIAEPVKEYKGYVAVGFPLHLCDTKHPPKATVRPHDN
jgi:hypothetical protein